MLTEATTLLSYTVALVLGLALISCYSLIQLNKMAAVIAVLVLGLGISITRMNVLTHGEVATYTATVWAAVIAVLVLGLGISITCINVLTHGEVASYNGYGVGAVMAVLVLGLGTSITCMNVLTHGEVATYNGYGVGGGAPGLGWGLGKVSDLLRSRRRLPAGAFLGQRGEWCLETYRKAPEAPPRPLAASPGAFPPHPVALAQLLGG